MTKISVHKLFFLLLWCAALAAVGVEIYKLEQPAEREGMAIAVANSLSGDVQFKQDGRLAWYDVQKRQTFQSGDRITTSASGQIILKFNGGGEVKLGQNSQIKLAAIKSANGLGLHVDLLQGTLDVNQEGNNSNSFLIKAGKEEVNLDRNNRALSVRKMQGEEVFVERRAEPLVMRLAARTLVPAAESVLPPPPPPPEVKAPAVLPEKPVVKPKKVNAYGYEVVTPNRFWIADTAKVAAADSMKILLKFQEVKPQWAISLKTEGPGKIANIRGRRLANSNLVEFEVPLAHIVRHGVVDDYAKVIGFAPQIEGLQAELIPKSFALELGDLRVFAKSGLVLLEAERFAGNADEMSASRQTIFGDGGNKPMPVKLYLGDADTLSRVLPLLRGSQSLKVKRVSKVPEDKMIIFGRSNQFVAAAARLGQPQIEILHSQLKTDTAFIGRAEDMIGLGNLTRDGIRALIKSRAGEIEKIYIAKGKQVVPVSIDFLVNSSEARKFLDQNATSFFLKEVKIVAIR